MIFIYLFFKDNNTLTKRIKHLFIFVLIFSSYCHVTLQSAQKMTGHTETSLASEHKILHGKGSSGFQLTNKGWHTF